jgi:hypothetical protein
MCWQWIFLRKRKISLRKRNSASLIKSGDHLGLFALILPKLTVKGDIKHISFQNYQIQKQKIRKQKLDKFFKRLQIFKRRQIHGLYVQNTEVGKLLWNMINNPDKFM